MFGLADSVLLKVFGLASVALLITLLAFAGYHHTEVSLLETKLTESQEKVGELTTANATLKSANDQMALAVKDQNKKVEELLSEVKKAGETSARAVMEAKKEADKWKQKYRAILNAPPVSADVCTDLSAKVNAYLSLRAEGGL